jgi:hypothetical protein
MKVTKRAKRAILTGEFNWTRDVVLFFKDGSYLRGTGKTDSIETKETRDEEGTIVEDAAIVEILFTFPISEKLVLEPGQSLAIGLPVRIT